MSAQIYVAVTGTKHYFGSEVFKTGQLVRLVKDPHNSQDEEAIQAEIVPIGKAGYIANSPYTVPRGCRSAGRIYDTFEECICGLVRFIVNDTVIVELTPNVEEGYDVKDYNQKVAEVG